MLWSGTLPPRLDVSSCMSERPGTALWWPHLAWALKTEKEGCSGADGGEEGGTGSGTSMGKGPPEGRSPSWPGILWGGESRSLARVCVSA